MCRERRRREMDDDVILCMSPTGLFNVQIIFPTTSFAADDPLIRARTKHAFVSPAYIIQPPSTCMSTHAWDTMQCEVSTKTEVTCDACSITLRSDSEKSTRPIPRGPRDSDQSSSTCHILTSRYLVLYHPGGLHPCHDGTSLLLHRFRRVSSYPFAKPVSSLTTSGGLGLVGLVSWMAPESSLQNIQVCPVDHLAQLAVAVFLSWTAMI